MSLTQIKTRVRQRPVMTLAIALAMVALMTVAVLAAEYVLSPAGDVETVNGAVYIAFEPSDPTGR